MSGSPLPAEQACAKFVMWALMNGSWQGADIDGGAAQDKAAELGLIVETIYDPEQHGPNDCCDAGDSWYVPTEALANLISGIAQGSTQPVCDLCDAPLMCAACGHEQRPALAQASLPPIVDRNELIALLEDLASVNLSREAVERQARRMADDLIARGLTFAAPQPASTPANFVTIPTNLAQRLRDHLQQADSFVWLDEIQMLDAALPSTPREAPHD